MMKKTNIKQTAVKTYNKVINIMKIWNNSKDNFNINKYSNKMNNNNNLNNKTNHNNTRMEMVNKKNLYKFFIKNYK